MKRFLILAALVAAPALADVSAVAGSLSGAAAQSGSLSAATQGNAQQITINGAAIPTNTLNESRLTGTSTVRTAPMVYAPPMGVTAPCRIALSVGVSVVAVGGSLGGSVEDLKCNWRENARIAHGIGDLPTAKYWEIAIARLECIDADDKTRRALGDMCSMVGIPDPNAPVPQPRPVAVAPAPVPMVAAPVPMSETKACRTEYQDGIMTKICPL